MNLFCLFNLIVLLVEIITLVIVGVKANISCFYSHCMFVLIALSHNSIPCNIWNFGGGHASQHGGSDECHSQDKNEARKVD